MKNKKPSFANAFKFLALALPFLFIAPIVITIGFKALKKDGAYLFLFLGIILALVAIIITAMGIIKISKYIFDKDNDKD
ncbi:MAG: DUF6095 family protein [Aureibaculum sp.]|nr:DUF6095 family protein [Aureibaculum sp.]